MSSRSAAAFAALTILDDVSASPACAASVRILMNNLN